MTRFLAGVLSCLLAYPSWAGPPQEANPPHALTISILEGEGVTNNARARVARDPVVQVEDENHKPVAGAVVTFTTPNQGPSAVFSNGSRSLTVTTDSNGQAVARGMHPTGQNGQFDIHVSASSNGTTANATISQTNAFAGAAAGASAGISAKMMAIIIAGVAAGIAGGAVAATHGGGHTTTPTPTTTTITPGTPTVGGPK